MEVKLISHQEDALDILLYTKSTRLQGATLEDIRAWSMERKLEELAYMRDTIKSSWEFATYIFEIRGVTRAFTHQLVRTRTASYAQEAMRVIDASQSPWLTPPGYSKELDEEFDAAMLESLDAYQDLVEKGMARQDARGVIPTNIQTNIIMAANLRTLSQMAEVRLCTRTQGEYQDVFREMRQRVIEVHPWAEGFIQVFCANHGTCCFPRYTECPIQKLTNKPSEEQLAEIKRVWEDERHEANVELISPGRTM